MALLCSISDAIARRATVVLPRGTAGAACLLALAWLASPGAQAQTQTETTFISNIGRSTIDDARNVRATSFTTGAGAYLLSSVDLYSVDSSGTTPRVQIYENDSANSQPGDLLATLTNPGSITDSAANTFTDPANTPLESDTVYWLVSNSAASDGTGFRIRTHGDTDANSGAAAGWSIGDALFKRSIADTSWLGTSRRIQFEIRGYAGTTPPPPASTREVPADWALKPADIRAGGQFRLMFVSSTSRDATSTNIIDYNRVVRSRAGSAAEISSYARDFNALVSTESVNARENTLTRSADPEAPIYWVRSGAVDAGSRVVDGYAGLYAGTWSTGATGYSESGSSVGLDSNRFWTGTELGGGTDGSGFLGAANVRYWFFDPAIDSGTATSASTYRIAGLSPVFQVANSIPGKPTGLTATASGESQIDLSWTAPDDNGGTAIIGYRIEVSNHGTRWSDLVGDTGNTDTTYSHTGLSPSVIRYYRVSAINGIGASVPSDRADATTGGTRVSDVLVSNTGQSDVAGLGLGANVYAQPFNTGDHTGGYHLAGVVLDFETVPSAAAGTITVTVREDSSGNPSGNVLYTLINPTFSVGSNEFRAPLSAELNEDRTYWVVASHAGSHLDGPNWLRTRISDGLDAGSVVGWSIDASYKQTGRVNPGFWQDGSISPLQAFQIAVKGSIKDSATVRPGAPQNFTAMQGDTRMTLSWAEPADAGSLAAAITKYQYRFSPGATVAGGAIWNDVPDSIDLDASTADETQVVVTGLSNGTLYAFEVRAVSSAGNGVAAGPRNATPRHVLATNVGQDPYASWGISESRLAQAFTTGSNASGYTLQSIELDFEEVPKRRADVAALTVSLWSATAAGEPNTAVATLINPVNLSVVDEPAGGSLSEGVKAFRAPANTGSGMSANTKYFVHAVCNQCFRVAIHTTESNVADAGHDATWRISDELFFQLRDNPSWRRDARFLKIGINGTTGGGGAATNNAPTAADNTVTIGLDAAYTLKAADFGFADTDTGDTLASVRIETLPAAGELALDGTAAVVDQVVTRADIDDNKLTFTPVTGATGDNYASFMFKVNDGTDFSADANTITFNLGVSVGEGPTDIWSATLTPAKNGYCVPAAGHPCADESYGELSDNDFILDGTTYTVERIGFGSTHVHLTLDKDFPAASLPNLTLHVGSHSFALSEAARGILDGDGLGHVIDNNYRWTDPPAEFKDLEEGATLTVKLVSG